MDLSGVPLGNGKQVQFLDEVFSLGVVLDSTLLQKPQVTQVTKKKAIKTSLDFGLSKHAPPRPCGKSLLKPHFNYSIAVPFTWI